jgi:hypothetical protein
MDLFAVLDISAPGTVLLTIAKEAATRIPTGDLSTGKVVFVRTLLPPTGICEVGKFYGEAVRYYPGFRVLG